MGRPFLLRNRVGGLLAMAGQRSRIENAARLAMADLGSGLSAPAVATGPGLAARLAMIAASLAAAGLLALAFF
jgi:hypothetical protein